MHFLCTFIVFCVFHSSLHAQPSGTNTIMDEENRTYHLGVKEGEVASSCLLVGDHGRAQRLLHLMDDVRSVGKNHRHFYTYTGTFQGKKLTLMSIGMGIAMMDFAVREIAQVTHGRLKFFRLGSAGTFRSDIFVGSIAVAHSSALIQTDYQNFDDKECPYLVSKPFEGHQGLLQKFELSIKKKGLVAHEGLDVTCEEFYATQGRRDANFIDKNETLLDFLEQKHPETVSLQMETFKLYNLVQRAQKREIQAGAAAIIFAQRSSEVFLSDDEKKKIEVQVGQAAMEALLSD
ncbi:MAG: hypothetical protein AB8C84_10480 [Oligoflexales bacterium]